jgi:4-amino-4-deoxy-L-arabinose transferase-like glycosyltransferase
MDASMEDSSARGSEPRNGRRDEWLIVALAAVIFLGCVPSPPHLMDDVDAVQAQIARNMLESGDWVTARLNGVKYLEKSPLIYWLMAGAMAILGPHDWAARLPLALLTVVLCWVTYRFARWAFGGEAAFYSGLAITTCVGLFLFTRIQIPDAMLTLTITLAMWSLARALEEDEPHPRRWAYGYWAAIGVGLLLKGLIAAVFPLATAVLYIWFTRRDWRRLRPVAGIPLLLLIAAPWHILATLRNPPYFDLTLSSDPGQYRGFFWFYFINEHVLRFLNQRYPRDYNTVPRIWFWLFHLLWLFPWSLYLPAALRTGYAPRSRAYRGRVLCLCWSGFILGFFTFSTTQEYYSMPCYPALAMLLGAAIAAGGKLTPFGTRMAAAVATAALITIGALLYLTRGVATPGDIASALTQNPEVYTLSLGHMRDLTLDSFAYLRLPLALAGIAFLGGAAVAWRFDGRVAALGLALMMTLFFHAARQALKVFDPYLGSHALAQALKELPPGRLIVDDQYYAFSSVFFYTNRQALLLHGRVNNLEYGSYAPGAPDVFIDDTQFQELWLGPERCYLVIASPNVPRVEAAVGRQKLYVAAFRGGKFVFSNRPARRG